MDRHFDKKYKEKDWDKLRPEDLEAVLREKERNRIKEEEFFRAFQEIDDPEAFEFARPKGKVDWKEDSALFSAREIDEFNAVLAEIASRRVEALKIFEPSPLQESFFSCHADERIFRGGNRAGKTLASCVEVARALTGQDPHGKYPERDGRAVLVGKDLIHCSKVLYRKLFKPGSFQMIRDPETKALRSFRPWNEWDKENESLAVPAPPLIASRYYQANWISWEDKREEIAKSVRFTTGWELTFFSSLSAPPQGWDVDLVDFDEEIEHPAWYPEMSARLIDRRKYDKKAGKPVGGKFIWSATPQAATQVLYDLCSKAREQSDAGVKEPSTVEFYSSMLDNPHLTDAAKQIFVEKLSNNEDEYRIRVLGEFALTGVRVYADCQPKGLHGVKAFAIPDDWPIYCAIDPGRQVCAVLFMTIPPSKGSEYSGHKIIFGELYLRRCDAKKLAEAMRDWLGGRPIQDWLIDSRASRNTEIGSGKTVEYRYRQALMKVNVKSEKREYGFRWADDNVKAGIEAVRTGLNVVNGQTEWLIMYEKVPNFVWELERYSYKRLPSKVVTDDPIQVNNHLMDCWRYLAQARFTYVKPKAKKKERNYTGKLLKEKKEREAARKKSKDPSSGGIQLW